MLPEQPISFPNFMADQLLTAANLNDLFHYLDVQDRGSRINLTGIGVVCGLELSLSASGTTITISQGTGITSSGYLIRWDTTSFQYYKSYDPLREAAYSPFLAGAQKRFDLYELKTTSAEEDLTQLTTAWLSNKVVMLFVELLEKDAKNCDPDSCDDKGKNTTLSIRPLILDKGDALLLTGDVTNGIGMHRGWAALPEFKMPRHHLPASDMDDSAAIFNGFIQVLNEDFLDKVEGRLTQAYHQLGWVSEGIFASNPFEKLKEDFIAIFNGNISSKQLLYTQYYYDLISDVVAAYNELRQSGNNLISLCCPDEGLFARHLLLGSITNVNAPRHTFIPSPALSGHAQRVGEVRMLLRRIQLLLENFKPELQNSFQQIQANENRIERPLERFRTSLGKRLGKDTSDNKDATTVKITPSRHGNVPLSQKSIPYYYEVLGGSYRLLDFWRPQNSYGGAYETPLSYHASSYAAKNEDELRNPLKYDLEPYNFLRIEGHVGMNYVDALSQIKKLQITNLLPIDVIALSANVANIVRLTAQMNLPSLIEKEDNQRVDMDCHFQDLEAHYHAASKEILCVLCKEMKFYYAYPPEQERGDGTQLKPTIVPLLKNCDPKFKYRTPTFGSAFEDFWAEQEEGSYVRARQLLRMVTLKDPTTRQQGKDDINVRSAFTYLLYYMEKLSEVMTTALSTFNTDDFVERYTDLVFVARYIKTTFGTAAKDEDGKENPESRTALEDFIDHLDVWIFGCHDVVFISLLNDYKARWLQLNMLRSLGYYSKMHPGMQHKAGVTMGGTFILVYHEKDDPIIKADFAQNEYRLVQKVIVGAMDDTSVKKLQEQYNFPKETTISAYDVALAARKRVQETETRVARGEDKNTVIEDMKKNDTVEPKEKAGRLDAIAEMEQNPFQKMMISDSVAAYNKKMLEKLSQKAKTNPSAIEEAAALIPDEIVIADFYLPYICCSDCPPVQYIINSKSEPDPEAPTITLEKNEYCNSDDESYPITVSPEGGKLKIDGEEIKGNVFIPNTIKLEEALSKKVTLTYTANGKDALTTVEVFAKPIPDFEAVSIGKRIVHFRNLSKMATQFIWDFGDGQKSKETDPSHTYGDNKSYPVSLTAINKICSDTNSKEVEISIASVTLNAEEICSDVDSLSIKVYPAGGKVTEDGVTKKEGDLIFKPSQVNFLPGQAQKKISFKYEVNGQTAETSITVIRTPSAVISASPSTAPKNSYNFSTANDFSATYSWNFGDGDSSQMERPSHNYKDSGTFEVSLKVSNGVCENTGKTKVTIKPNVTEPPMSTCGSLKEIHKQFDDFWSGDNEKLSFFKEIFKSKSAVEDFMKSLEEVENGNEEKQTEFFKSKGADVLIAKWFKELSELAKNSRIKEETSMLRTMLETLSTYIDCIVGEVKRKRKLDTSINLLDPSKRKLPGGGTIKKEDPLK